MNGEEGVSLNLGTEARPLRVAIIGAGPAGFFTTDALLKTPDLACEIDLFNRLPTPYGLVREGVAPDHPSIKRVTGKFDRILEDPAVRFFGNVTFGEDVSLNDLRGIYDQIVYAVGAQSDRRLGIPGEDLAGSCPATSFVGWYNGHPDYRDLEFDLSCGRAVVIGNGNVAVDVARILVTDPEELAATDIADYALAALRESRVREVVMLGRRGPVQAKFTSVELKELGKLAGVDVIVDPAELELDEASAAALEDARVAKKNLAILEEFAAREPTGAPRRLVLRFLTSPAEVLGEGGRVCGLRTERNRLAPQPGGYLQAEGTGRFEEMEAGLVLRSVGYRGVPLPDVPFEERRGTIPNESGRVTREPEGEVIPGEYVVGWAKRGPSGIIGTNKPDAAATVQAMVEDAAAGVLAGGQDGATDDGSPPGGAPRAHGPDAILALLAERKPDYVAYEDWKVLDAEERARGERVGRPRVKVTRVAEMLEILGK